MVIIVCFFFFQAEDGIRDADVTGVQTCALPIWGAPPFWPWTQVIRALTEDRDEQTLAAWLGAGAAQVAQLVPELAERLGMTAPPLVASRESEAARFYLFEAVSGFLEQAASVEPL